MSALCCQVNPEFSSKKSSSIFKIGLSQLTEMKNYFKSFIDESGDLVIPKTSLSINKELINHLRLLDTVDLENRGSKDDKLKCKICNKIVERERMRLHIGFHILSNHIAQSQDTCGYCGF